MDEVTGEKDEYKRKYEEEKVFWNKPALQPMLNSRNMLYTEPKQAAEKGN